MEEDCLAKEWNCSRDAHGGRKGMRPQMNLNVQRNGEDKLSSGMTASCQEHMDVLTARVSDHHEDHDQGDEDPDCGHHHLHHGCHQPLQ